MLKLPANKFTKREKEMLTGSGLVPPEFFASGKAYLGFGFVIGAHALAALNGNLTPLLNRCGCVCCCCVLDEAQQEGGHAMMGGGDDAVCVTDADL